MDALVLVAVIAPPLGIVLILGFILKVVVGTSGGKKRHISAPSRRSSVADQQLPSLPPIPDFDQNDSQGAAQQPDSLPAVPQPGQSPSAESRGLPVPAPTGSSAVVRQGPGGEPGSSSVSSANNQMAKPVELPPVPDHESPATVTQQPENVQPTHSGGAKSVDPVSADTVALATIQHGQISAAQKQTGGPDGGELQQSPPPPPDQGLPQRKPTSASAQSPPHDETSVVENPESGETAQADMPFPAPGGVGQPAAGCQPARGFGAGRKPGNSGSSKMADKATQQETGPVPVPQASQPEPADPTIDVPTVGQSAGSSGTAHAGTPRDGAFPGADVRPPPASELASAPAGQPTTGTASPQAKPQSAAGSAPAPTSDDETHNVQNVTLAPEMHQTNQQATALGGASAPVATPDCQPTTEHPTSNTGQRQVTGTASAEPVIPATPIPVTEEELANAHTKPLPQTNAPEPVAMQPPRRPGDGKPPAVPAATSHATIAAAAPTVAAPITPPATATPSPDTAQPNEPATGAMLGTHHGVNVQLAPAAKPQASPSTPPSPQPVGPEDPSQAPAAAHLASANTVPLADVSAEAPAVAQSGAATPTPGPQPAAATPPRAPDNPVELLPPAADAMAATATTTPGASPGAKPARGLGQVLNQARNWAGGGVAAAGQHSRSNDPAAIPPTHISPVVVDGQLGVSDVMEQDSAAEQLMTSADTRPMPTQTHIADKNDQLSADLGPQGTPQPAPITQPLPPRVPPTFRVGLVGALAWNEEGRKHLNPPLLRKGQSAPEEPMTEPGRNRPEVERYSPAHPLSSNPALGELLDQVQHPNATTPEVAAALKALAEHLESTPPALPTPARPQQPTRQKTSATFNGLEAPVVFGPPAPPEPPPVVVEPEPPTLIGGVDAHRRARHAAPTGVTAERDRTELAELHEAARKSFDQPVVADRARTIAGVVDTLAPADCDVAEAGQALPSRRSLRAARSTSSDRIANPHNSRRVDIVPRDSDQMEQTESVSQVSRRESNTWQEAQAGRLARKEAADRRKRLLLDGDA